MGRKAALPRILVVDDDASLRRIVEYNLAEEGYAVATAGSGEEALDSLEKAGFDLVVIAQRLHAATPQGRDRLLDQALRALAPGGRIVLIGDTLVHEWPDENDLADIAERGVAGRHRLRGQTLRRRVQFALPRAGRPGP